jgi:hypothetical protein
VTYVIPLDGPPAQNDAVRGEGDVTGPNRSIASKVAFDARA